MAAQLERETQALLASLEERVDRRLEELRMSLNANVLKKIRLSSADLKVVYSFNTSYFFEFNLLLATDGIGAVSHDDAFVLPDRDLGSFRCQRVGIVGAL